MIFNRHSELAGQHAFLGASSYHWINYDTEKISSRYRNFLATLNGTKDHELAAMLIERGVKLPRSRKTLNMFVNDAIGYQMTPEQPLYFSPNSFGTTEWIWTAILILVGDFIGCAITIKNRDAAYGVVIIWAYIGILTKHMSQNGFAGMYPAIIVTVIFCIITLIITEIYVFMKKN